MSLEHHADELPTSPRRYALLLRGMIYFQLLWIVMAAELDGNQGIFTEG